MTVYLDSSALLALHIDSSSRTIVHDALQSDDTWASCALGLSESLAAISRMTEEEVLRRYLEDKIRHTWDFLHVVPLDQVLLDESALLCSQQPVGLSAALHLCAAQRLPGPLHFVTFESGHIPVALSMGFSVVSG